MDRRVAIIDADSFIYIAAWFNKDTEDPMLVKVAVNDMLVELIQNTKATHYLGVFTPSKTFRNRITETYKAQRPPTPEWVKKWKQVIIDHCINEYGFVVAEDHEADDVLSIMQGPDSILCHIDKDINQVPGDHYDYKKKTIYNVDPTAAEYNFWYQVIIGDTTDNIKGAKKAGPVTASKLLSLNPLNYEGATKELFKQKNGETWEKDYEETVQLIKLLPPTKELVEFYTKHIQEVGRESDEGLVDDLLNHDKTVLRDTERSHEGDVLRPSADFS